MVFKKDLTPIGKGGIDKVAGKGAQDRPRDVMSRVTNRYPKPPSAPPSKPSGLTPPFGIGGPPEEA